MKRRLLFVALMSLFLTSVSQHISNEILLDDGRKVSFDHIFKDVDNCTFKSDRQYSWAIAIEVNSSSKNGIEFIIDKSRPSNSYHLDMSIYDMERIYDLFGSYAFAVAYDVGAKRYFKSWVIIYDGETIIEKNELRLNLSPDMPQILSAQFDYEYDWEYDDLGIDGGTLHLKLYVGAIKHLWYDRSWNTAHAFEKPDDSSFNGTCSEGFSLNIDGTGELMIPYLDWGDYIRIHTANRSGYSKKLIISSTDFINDPAIRDRINSLNPNASSTAISRNDFEIIRRGDMIIISGDNDFEVDITDISGRIIMSEANNRNIDISHIPHGIFIACLKSNNRIIKTLKLSK